MSSASAPPRPTRCTHRRCSAPMNPAHGRSGRRSPPPSVPTATWAARPGSHRPTANTRRRRSRGCAGRARRSPAPSAVYSQHTPPSLASTPCPAPPVPPDCDFDASNSAVLNALPGNHCLAANVTDTGQDRTHVPNRQHIIGLSALIYPRAANLSAANIRQREATRASDTLRSRLRSRIWRASIHDALSRKALTCAAGQVSAFSCAARGSNERANDRAGHVVQLDPGPGRLLVLEG